jgi:Dual specificity phosphatase, catalytic domain
MNAIRDWFYIGKYSDTVDSALLRSQGIGAILELAEVVKHADVECLFLPVEDGVHLSSRLLREGVGFVVNQKRFDRKVLIACGAGKSRSVAFAVAVLKEDEGLPLLEALRAVKSHHPETMLHPALWESLCAYYQEDVPFWSALRVMTSSVEPKPINVLFRPHIN